MLGHRPQATGNRCFLKRVSTDCRCRYLPADDHDGCGIGHAISNRRDHVGCPRPGRYHNNTHLTAGNGVTCRHKTGTLLVRRHNQRHGFCTILFAMFIVITENGVIGWQDGPATVPKYGVNTFVNQYLYHHLGTGHGFTCQCVRCCVQII